MSPLLTDFQKEMFKELILDGKFNISVSGGMIIDFTINFPHGYSKYKNFYLEMKKMKFVASSDEGYFYMYLFKLDTDNLINLKNMLVAYRNSSTDDTTKSYINFYISHGIDKCLSNRDDVLAKLGAIL